MPGGAAQAFALRGRIPRPEGIEMNRSFAGLMWILAAMLVAIAGAARPAMAKGGPLLVDAAWLAPRLDDHLVVVLHVGDRAGYDRAHIPGARQITEGDLARPHDMSRGELMLELPEPETLRAKLASLGVSDDSVIVVYAGEGVPLQSATRVMFTLDYLGLGEQSSLLDGGLAAWRSARRPVTGAALQIAPGTLSARAPRPIVADAATVRSLSDRANVKVIDARAPVFYSGAEETFGKRGHLPHAINIPFSDVSDAAGHIEPAALARLFQAAGVTKDDTVVAYCHVGQQATAVVFAARLLGVTALLYDGAFQDWASNDRGAVEQ